MMKKGDISITTIIVAAIALIVLIVLIAIFANRIGLFGKTYDTQTADTRDKVCNARGGICGNNCVGGIVAAKPDTGWIDCSSGQDCCRTA